ncbi:MAG: hypothetical protein GX025_10245 [Clostridiales bacterium]|nr:hypothetical protein [Clostridiales bacterium]
MIHAEFKLYDKFSQVLISIPYLYPGEELTKAVMAHTEAMTDAVHLSSTLKLKKGTFPKIERHSDGFQLVVEVERRSRDLELLDEYVELVETDLLELHDIFRSLIQDTIQELESAYPAIFLRRY